MNDHTQVIVSVLPACDFCKLQGRDTRATVDGKTQSGPWANMCPSHWQRFGIGEFGLGRAQLLVVR